MKTWIITLGVASATVCGVGLTRLSVAAEGQTSRVEYVTIKWDGEENTHIVRPGGQVEFIGAELRKVPKPNHADEKTFYMNLAVNGLTKEGYEIAVIEGDEIFMKRTVR